MTRVVRFVQVNKEYNHSLHAPAHHCLNPTAANSVKGIF